MERRAHRAVASAIAFALATVSLVGCGGGGSGTPASPTRTPTSSVSPTSSASTPTSGDTPTNTIPAPTQSPTVSPTKSPAPSPTSTGLPAALAGHVMWRIPTTEHVVALTFDGGSGGQGAASVLSTLGATGVPATFFLTGRFAQTYPQTAQAIAASGILGNHTMTHPHLTQLSSSAVRAEVTDAETAITATTRRAAKPWFRFPFGEYDARTLGIVNDLGYAAIGWTVDTLGWEGRAGAGTVDDVVARVLARLQPGTIVLMHLGAAPDGSTLDADALPQLITAIRHAGYFFVTVNTMR